MSVVQNTKPKDLIIEYRCVKKVPRSAKGPDNDDGTPRPLSAGDLFAIALF